jgi:hypothetical protein
MAGVAIVVFSDLVDSTALLARLGDDRIDVSARGLWPSPASRYR